MVISTLAGLEDHVPAIGTTGESDPEPSHEHSRRIGRELGVVMLGPAPQVA